MDFVVKHVLDEFPFPLQRVQTDRDSEFFGQVFQRGRRDHRIKFRPVRPRSLRLNGKVERSQQTDQVEFWATAYVAAPDLGDRLGEWQHCYNWHRQHTSLNGKTPMARFFELMEQMPFSWDVDEQYDPAKAQFRVREFSLDQQALQLK